MSLSSEILVHIGASSRASDDARHRRELQAFLGFQPVRQHILISRHPRPTIQPQYGSALEQVADASFGSSSDPASEAAACRHKALEDLNSELVTPTSTTFNSSGSPPKTRALVPGTTSHEQIRRTRVSSTILPRSRIAPSKTHGSLSIKDTPCHRVAQTDSWETPPSVIPDSQPTPYSQTRSAPQSSSSPTTRKRQRTRSPPVFPRYETNKDEDENQAFVTLPPSSSLPVPPSSDYAGDAEGSSTPIAPPPSSPQDAASSTPVAASPFVFIPSSLEIYPPRAPVTIRKFKTHKTKALSKLATERLPLERVYAPQIVAQTREPYRDERGFWRIQLTNFSEELKSSFWAFLQNYVGRGSAGWGVLCFLVGRDERIPGLIEDALGCDDGQENRLIARVYCWGEIVGEVWNVLFIASNRKIKGDGACWVGHEGNVVIEMK